MKKIIFFFIALIYHPVFGQEDLLKDLEQTAPVEPQYVSATFKSTRVINSHSTETLGKNQLDFRISHRFGRVNSGAYNFFGLDQATIRLGLEYGINDRINIGIGRSSWGKTFDGYLKLKLLRQRADKSWAMPVSVVWLSNAGLTTLETSDEYVKSNTSGRISYVHQLLIARKFNEFFSLQFAPSLVHRNYVADLQEKNDVYALQAGARIKISKRISINGDYILRLNNTGNDTYRNSAALGVDIETGGHVFQLHVTNSQGMIEQYFIAQTDGRIDKGDIYYGFNISRQFNLSRKRKKENIKD